MQAVCAQCAERAARLRCRHGRSPAAPALPFCSEACSEAYCRSGGAGACGSWRFSAVPTTASIAAKRQERGGAGDSDEEDGSSEATKSDEAAGRTFAPVELPPGAPRKLDDLVGLQSEAAVLRRRVLPALRYPRLAAQAGARAANVFLYGPGGTGKTSIAQAIAAEEGLLFFDVRPSDVQSSYQAMSKIYFAKLLETVRKAAEAHPRGALLLIDEADELLRDPPDSAAADQSVVVEFKERVPGEGIPKVLIVAATNFPYRIMDTAVLRRFPVKLYVGLPDRPSRLAFLERELRKLYTDRTFESCVGSRTRFDDLLRAIRQRADEVARLTRARTPAELADIVRDATSREPLGIARADDLTFCRRGGDEPAPRRAPGAAEAARRIVYEPRPKAPATEGSAYATSTAEGKRARGAAEACETAESVERRLADGSDVVVCWPVLTYERLLESLTGSSVRRNVTVEAMQQFARYAREVALDEESYARCHEVIDDLVALSDEAASAGSRRRERGAKP